MSRYEAVVILRPNLTPEKLEEDINKVKALVTKAQGNITQEDRWGKRTLAYMIKKQKEGFYLIFQFEADPSTIRGLTQELRLLEEEVLRALITLAVAPRAQAKKAPEAAVVASEKS